MRRSAVPCVALARGCLQPPSMSWPAGTAHLGSAPAGAQVAQLDDPELPARAPVGVAVHAVIRVRFVPRSDSEEQAQDAVHFLQAVVDPFEQGPVGTGSDSRPGRAGRRPWSSGLSGGAAGGSCRRSSAQVLCRDKARANTRCRSRRSNTRGSPTMEGRGCSMADAAIGAEQVGWLRGRCRGCAPARPCPFGRPTSSPLAPRQDHLGDHVLQATDLAQQAGAGVQSCNEHRSRPRSRPGSRRAAHRAAAARFPPSAGRPVPPAGATSRRSPDARAVRAERALELAAATCGRP